MNTYTPWATNVKLLEKSCLIQTFEILQAQGCGDFIPNPANFRDFMLLVHKLISVSMDDNAWYVRLGGVSTDYSNVVPFDKKLKVVEKLSEKNKNENNSHLNDNNNDNKNENDYQNSKYNGIEQLDLLVIQNSTFSIRVFDRDDTRLVESKLQLAKVSTYGRA